MSFFISEKKSYDQSAGFSRVKRLILSRCFFSWLVIIGMFIISFDSFFSRDVYCTLSPLFLRPGFRSFFSCSFGCSLFGHLFGFREFKVYITDFFYLLD